MDQKMNVYIWDMDETLILLKSLINEKYAESFNGSKNWTTGVRIGKAWEKHILQICDDNFFYEQIENCNMPYLDTMSQYDDGRDLTDYDFDNDGFSPPADDANKRKLAYRHRVIAQKYKKGLHSILNGDMIKCWNDLYDETDSYTDRWLSSARTCLEQCASANAELTPSDCSPIDANDGQGTKYQHVNVLVTSGTLIPSLVKCLFFRLGDIIPYENVYSAWNVGKMQCFTWIRERFSGPNVQFCVIGDGWEECEAAEAMRWPFVKIDPFSSKYHRFPGLTPKDLDLYLAVVYENRNDEKNKEDLKSPVQP
ncbi:PREDICTED: eyes absent homolog 4 [Ipomoea nil]|uniref:eyes absent homolog 4 n=1 Tax=Ipomoea nil TaxID=35883 RepID=UPI000900A372|nr:PREDICTED: eyes absent homolog 4 [Ipomoea nil]XP_019190892.1 PREDICTED: eyes absent homolog 4 [Ipomoea nil]